jgi:hypothetical protein
LRQEIPPCEKFHKFDLRARDALRKLLLTVRFVPASVLSLSIAFGFSACGPKVTDRNIDAVNKLYEAAEKTGKSVSIKEVEAVLGQPTKTEPFRIEKPTTQDLLGVRYYYEENGHTVELHFVDNKLSKKVLHFGEKPLEDAELRKMPPRPGK